MKKFSILTAILVIGLVPAAFADIALNSPTTDWYAMTYSGTGRTDYLNDQQTGDNESDLVGTAAGVTPAQTAFYFDFDGVQIGFRVRVDGEGQNGGAFKGAVWVGMMLDGNDSVDLFAGAIVPQNGGSLGFYSPGPGANTGPSTTTIADTPLVPADSLGSSNYAWAAVTAVNDPVINQGGTTDVGGDGKNDYFITWVMDFSDLQAAALARGFTVTASSQIRFVVGTAQQGNAINQDLNGTSGNLKNNDAGYTSTFVDLGAVSPVVTAGGGVVPEPGTLSYAFLALSVFFYAARWRNAVRRDSAA